MIYSKTCEYALRALSYLALQPKGEFIGTTEISKESGIAGPYAAKIFQQLVKAGLLKSRRGVGGGVALVKSPEKVSLLEVIEAIEETFLFEECVMGLDHCQDKNPCPLHDIWKTANKKMIAELKKTRITDLGNKAKNFKYRKMTRMKLKQSGQAE